MGHVLMLQAHFEAYQAVYKPEMPTTTRDSSGSQRGKDFKVGDRSVPSDLACLCLHCPHTCLLSQPDLRQGIRSFSSLGGLAECP